MNKLKRYIVFLIGLFINSLGVSFITKANLGTSPISSIPYTLSLGFKPTLGQFTIYFSVFLIILQILILRKNFQKEQLLQFPVSILFGYFIDMTMEILFFVNPEVYPMKIVSLIIGCIILGFGVYLEVLADVVMLPGEAFVKSVTATFHTEFGITKVCFDATMTITAGIISFVLFKELKGVREGTIIAALIVGLIARFFGKQLAFLRPMLFKDEIKKVEEIKEIDKKSIIVTIGREYGSGGHQIGKDLAEKMGLKFYDNTIITMVSEESGFSKEFVKEYEQAVPHEFLTSILSQFYEYSADDESPLDRLFDAEKKVILELAKKGNCVIVGRCGDYILKEFPNAIHIFIHSSSKDFKEERVNKIYGVNKTEAINIIERTDKARSKHYKKYTGGTWGLSMHYDICIDSSVLGINGSVKVIEEFIKTSNKI